MMQFSAWRYETPQQKEQRKIREQKLRKEKIAAFHEDIGKIQRNRWVSNRNKQGEEL